jgi:phage gp29-like protein
VSRVAQALTSLGDGLARAQRIVRAAAAAAGDTPAEASRPAPTQTAAPPAPTSTTHEAPPDRAAPPPPAVPAEPAPADPGQERAPLTPGKAPPKVPGLTGGPAIARDTRPLPNQVQRAGSRLRPRDVSAICIRADNGYMQRICDLIADFRAKDCHLAGILQRRENAIGALTWQVVPASDRPKALRVAAFVEQALLAFGETLGPDGEELKDFRTLLCHLNGAVVPGYAVSEVLWKKKGRYVLPSGALPMPARRFIYSQYDGALRWWDESGPYAPYPGVDVRTEYAEGRFLVHRPRVSGGIGPREGMIRPLVWAALFRTWGLGDWLREGELAWKPYRIGTYKREAAPEDIEALDRQLELLTTAGWARVPETTNLVLQYAKGSRGGVNLHQALCDFLGAEMSKLVLGATLTVEQGRTGAMALGNVHASVAREILEVDARALEATIRRQLIAPLVWRNFGKTTPVPSFQFITDEGADLDKLSQALDRLLARGLAVPAAWVRAMFGIPEPEKGEELVGTGAPPPAAPPPPVKAPEEEPEATEPGGGGEEDENASAPSEGELVNDATMKRLARAFYRHNVLLRAGAIRPSPTTLENLA